MAELVTRSSRLAEVVADLLRQPAVALDLESNGFHRYPERVCLVQVATSGQCYLLDPLEIEDMAPLGELLAEPGVRKILHSADYDLRSLDRDWGFRVRDLYDTSVAAHFAGLERLGLGAAAERFLGVKLDKRKRLQRADWSIRPLSRMALDYAANDVAHLLPLRDALGARLRSLGREAWVHEECQRLEELRYVPPAPPEVACLAMKGSRALDGRGLAVLQRLALLREEEARRRGRPPFRVLSDASLVALAGNSSGDPRDAPGVTDMVMQRLGSKLRRTLREAAMARPVRRPEPPRPARPRMSSRETVRFGVLRAWRTEQGRRLELDPALVWPMASLERLARLPESLDAELRAPEVRRWQAKEFGAALRTALAVGGM